MKLDFRWSVMCQKEAILNVRQITFCESGQSCLMSDHSLSKLKIGVLFFFCQHQEIAFVGQLFCLFHFFSCIFSHYSTFDDHYQRLLTLIEADVLLLPKLASVCPIDEAPTLLKNTPPYMFITWITEVLVKGGRVSLEWVSFAFFW